MGLYYKKVQEIESESNSIRGNSEGTCLDGGLLYHQNFQNWMYQCRI